MKRKGIKKILAISLLAVLASLMLIGCGMVSRSKGDLKTTKENKEIIKEIKKIKTTKYQESNFLQEDIDSDTVQWMCASYAIFSQTNSKDLELIGGLQEDYADMTELIVKKMRGELWSGWEIKNRKTAMDKIQWLIEEGHRQQYLELVDEMIDNKVMDEKDLTKVFKEEEELNRAIATQKAYQAFGENGIDAWDLSRALQVIGDCYHAEYINLEETLDLSLPIAKKLQKIYGSWNELGTSYLYGHQFWRKDNPNDYSSESRNREEAYEKLVDMEDGPYELSYDTKLVSTWDKGSLDKVKEKKRAKEKAIQNEKEKHEIRPAKLGKDGYYTIVDYDRNASEKIKIPDGFVAGEDSYEKRMRLENEKMALELTYIVMVYKDVDEINEFLKFAPVYLKEIDAENAEILEDVLEDEEEPFRYYIQFAFDKEGTPRQSYGGYIFKELEDGSYQGVQVTFRGTGVIGLSKEETLDIMFSNIKIE